MGSEYTIRISTPADFTGLDGVKPRLEQIAAESAKAQAAVASLNEEIAQAITGQTYSQRLDEQIAALHDAANAANDVEKAATAAMQQRFANLKSAPHWTDKPGGASEESSGGGFAAMAGKAGLAAAAVALLSKGIAEVSESDRAEVALRKFGVAAEESASQAELLDKLELFTGDKVAAAELYGRTINGSTRGLVQFGIIMAENATRQERLSALMQLGARGADAQAAKNATLTGSLVVMGKGLADSAGDFLKWLGGVTGTTSAIGWLNDKLGFTKLKTDEVKASVAGMNQELATTPARAKEASAALADVAAAAAAAAGKIDAVNLGLAKAGKAPTDEELEDLDLQRREAAGEDPIAIAKERAKLKSDRAEKARLEDAQRAARAKAEADEALKKLDEVEREQNADPTRQRASDLAKMPQKDRERLRDPKTEKTYEEELTELRKRHGDEKAAIDAERRRALETKRQAEEVERGLPNRQKAARLEAETDAEKIKRLEGQREMERAQKMEGAQGKEREREQAEETRRQEYLERGAEAEKKVAEKLEAAAKQQAEKHGDGRLAKDSIARAKKAANERLHGMTADEAVDNADKVFEEEMGKFRKKDGSLRPREFQSAADAKGSALDQMPKPSGGAAAGVDKAAAGAAAIGPMLDKLTNTLNTIATAVKAQEGRLDQIAGQVAALDQRASSR